MHKAPIWLEYLQDESSLHQDLSPLPFGTPLAKTTTNYYAGSGDKEARRCSGKTILRDTELTLLDLQVMSQEEDEGDQAKEAKKSRKYKKVSSMKSCSMFQNLINLQD